MSDKQPMHIVTWRAISKPFDFPKRIDAKHGNVFYTGDTLVFASNEHEYFKFGLRIKKIK